MLISVVHATGLSGNARKCSNVNCGFIGTPKLIKNKIKTTIHRYSRRIFII